MGDRMSLRGERQPITPTCTMLQRRLGRTELIVSALALGTVELGIDYGIRAPGCFGKPSRDAARRLVQAAIDAGINLLDTARDYGDSESIIGQAIAGRRDQVILATKVALPLEPETCLRGEPLVTHMRDELDRSLSALQTDYVDIWQIHEVDEYVLSERDAIAEAFAEARRLGKIRFAGGSFYGADLPLRALEFDLFDTMQVTYSVLDQRLADQFFTAAAARDVAIIARSVLLKGVLTDRGDHLPDRFEPLRARSREFRRLIAEEKWPLDAAQTAVAFALAQPAIHSVLVGVRSESELRCNLLACQATLPAEFVTKIAALRLDDAQLLNPATWNID